jgi:hypothetical protein
VLYSYIIKFLTVFKKDYENASISKVHFRLLWDVMLCSLLVCYQIFGVKRFLRHQGRRYQFQHGLPEGSN